MYSPVEHGRERDQIALMRLIYQRAGAIYVLLGPPAGDSDLAIKTSADFASVYFFSTLMKAMDSCKLGSFVLSQSLLSIFGLMLQFQARPRSSYNISFQLRIFRLPATSAPRPLQTILPFCWSCPSEA
jgi:hypothetical protein